jgi:hypothetical protein
LVCQAHRFARFGGQSRSTLCEATDPEVTAGDRLEWDVLSRLVAVYAGPGPGVLLERYVYDADGRLAGRFAADGSSETYVYSGEQMVEAYDTDGEVLWQALWGPGLDALVEFRNVARDGPGAPPLLALTDFRRSVVGFVTADEDDALAVEGFVEYGPWGRVESVEDSPMGEGAGCVEAGQVGVQCALPGGSPFGFVGAWRSDRTGLVYMRHRWYDPRLGQFLSHDPLGAVDSANLYTYVAGDPINLWDPWGLEAQSSRGPADRATPQDPKPDPRSGPRTPSGHQKKFLGIMVGGGRKEALPGEGYAQPNDRGMRQYNPEGHLGEVEKSRDMVLDTAHEQIREHADPKDQAAAVVGGYAIRWIGKAGKYLRVRTSNQPRLPCASPSSLPSLQTDGMRPNLPSTMRWSIAMA